MRNHFGIRTRLLTLLLASVTLNALGPLLVAQPAWRPIGQILSAPAPIEIVPHTGDGLVVSTGSNVRALVDGGWTDATGLTGLGSSLAARLVRSASATLFISVSGSGTFESTDGGRSWSGRETEVMAASSTALFRQTPLTDTLQRSTDDGRSWTTVAQPFGFRPGILRLSADYRVREIIALGRDSIAISTDDGDTWSSLSPMLGNDIASEVIVTPVSMFVIDANCWETGGDMWRSTTSGRTWQRLGGDSPYSTTNVIEAVGGTIVRVDQGGAFISFDAGATWRPIAPGLCDEHPQTITALALDDQLRIVAATKSAGVFRYELGSWRETGFVGPTNPFAIRQFGDVLHARIDKAGWESVDGGTSWSCAKGAPEAVDERGSWYRSRRQVERSTDRGASWSIVGDDLSGMPYYSSLVPVVSARGTVLAAYAYEYSGRRSSGVLRLREDGTWMTIERHGAIVDGELLVSPDSTLYYRGGARLDRSTDDGLTWQAVNSSRRTSLVAADDGTLYALGDSDAGRRAWRSSDRGATWTMLDWGSRTPYSLKPHGARGLLVVYSDHAGVPYVGYSDNQGITIDEIMTGLDGALPERIYDTGSDAAILGTDRGMFRLDAVGAAPADPLPDALDLTINDRH